MSQPLHEVVIVGSGPAGYTAAIYCARAGLRPVVVAGSITAGGALMTTTEVENFPGFAAGIQGPELMAHLQEQAERFGAQVLIDDATALDLRGEIKTITTTDHGQLQARAVILATGSGYRKIGLPDEERLSGRGVSWCATCDGFFFRGQDIAVVGGGDSAMEEAMFLTRFADSVTVIHRRTQLRASKIMAQRARANDKIRFVLGAHVTAIHGQDTVTAVTVTDITTGQRTDLPVTALFIAIGHDPRSELLTGQVDLDDAGYVQVQGRTTLTNQPGVFASGDVVDHSYRQAITAAGSGCAAALDAERYLAALDDPALDNAALSSL